MRSFPSVPARRRAFTIAEMMMALAIMGLVSAGVVAFVHQALLTYYGSRGRLMINNDVRAITNKMDTDAVTANYFCIYPGFSSRTTGSGATLADAAVADGGVGDMLVLVYTDPAQSTSGVSMINRLVGYYREVTNATLNTGPVRRFDITISPAVSAASAPMYSILNTYVTGTIGSYPQLTSIAQGLENNAALNATTTSLFYNYQNRSILVSAQLSELVAEKGSGNQVGNTYNFTVSPRG